MNNKTLRYLAALGLALGGLLGLAGTFAPSPALRGLAWGIDGLGLVMASALLTVGYFRDGQDLVASGFLVFAVGQGLIVSGAAMDLPESVPSFGAGARPTPPSPQAARYAPINAATPSPCNTLDDTISPSTAREYQREDAFNRLPI